MTVSFGCISFDSNSLPKLHLARERAEGIARIATPIALSGSVGALIYKICGIALSMLTRGKLTLLGAVVVSSPLFYIPLGLVVTTAGGAMAVEKVSSYLISQIQQEPIEGDAPV